MRLRRHRAAHLLTAGALLATLGGAPPTAAAAADACPPTSSAEATTPPGVAALGRLRPGAPVGAIATHEGPPTEVTLARLERLGLAVQPLRHLPLTLLRGEPRRLRMAAGLPGVRDVHPDRHIALQSRTSAQAIRADAVWDEVGVTGRGIGIAIVDSGIDATHPAFEGRVRRNVKLVVPPAGPVAPLVIPVDEGPYSNTDSVGHGTHVAGIAAAADVGGDEVDSPAGVAPGAHLVGYAFGEADGGTLQAALVAFDDILERREQDAIRVVNASWGLRFRTFHPHDPLHLATRALHDAGIVVVFSAGNDAEEMTLNAAAAAPWVLSVASTSVDGAPSATSSGGLRYDNALAVDHPGHVRFDGDRLGLYRPDVAAPGEQILSTATPTGPAMGPGIHLPGGSAPASGTSMAAPHLAGVAALLLETRPELLPSQVERLVQVAARPVAGWSVWKAGYGLVDAHQAVALAASLPEEAIDAAHEARTRQLLARRDHTVVASDHWSVAAELPVSAAGLETRCLAFLVGGGRGVQRVRVNLAFAGTMPGTRNVFRWVASLRDAEGRLLGTTEVSARQGVASLEVDLEPATALGAWTIVVDGQAAVTAPALGYDPAVDVVVTQLAAQTPDLPTASDELELRLAGDSAPGPVGGPDGCAVDALRSVGALSTAPGPACRAFPVGFAASAAAGPAEFTSPPLAEPLAVGGVGTLVAHLIDEAQPAWSPAIGSRVLFTLDALDPAGAAPALVLGSGQPETQVASSAVRGGYPFDVPAVEIPAGWVLRLRLEVTGAPTVAMRLLYDGERDSAIVLPLSRQASG